MTKTRSDALTASPPAGPGPSTAPSRAAQRLTSESLIASVPTFFKSLAMDDGHGAAALRGPRRRPWALGTGWPRPTPHGQRRTAHAVPAAHAARPRPTAPAPPGPRRMKTAPGPRPTARWRAARVRRRLVAVRAAAAAAAVMRGSHTSHGPSPRPGWRWRRRRRRASPAGTAAAGGRGPAIVRVLVQVFVHVQDLVQD
jgi:hypothetical protein